MGKGIKFELNLRNKEWRNGLLASAGMLVLAVVFLAGGITMKTPVLIALGAIGTAMFGFFTYLHLDLRQHVSMQMVKKEMSYRQLKEALEAEDFERPLHFLRGAGKPTLLLISDDWMVIGDKIDTPVCIPKRKVKSIELCPEYVEFSAIESPDGQAHERLYYTIHFICDEKHSFHSGLISPDDLLEGKKVWDFIAKHFPHIDFHVVPLAEKDK